VTINSIFPSWYPQVEKDSKILVVGASGGMGRALLGMLKKGPTCTIGAHRFTGKPIEKISKEPHEIIDLQENLKTDQDCQNLVKAFVAKAGGVTGLVVLSGGISRAVHWMNLTEREWIDDINLNLNIPFFLSRAAMKVMEKKGGQIVLIGTESALHGGSAKALPYGVAKSGIECLVSGLARDGAKNKILVNGIRAGFIRTGFHERWQEKTEEDLKRRVEIIPLKRAGEPDEAVALIIFLLSGWANFITGQMLSISGGDWL
jgi:NAD(P)-dependent dehydrogenase (short-subunit alcohol dehydrogenase family)